MCDFTVTYANVIHFAHSNDFTEQTAAIQQAWIEYPYPQPTLHELSADLKNCLSQGPHSTTFDLRVFTARLTNYLLNDSYHFIGMQQQMNIIE